MIAIALYQPDIPQNTGNILRLGACLGLTVHVIGPTGFELSDRSLKRAGMDYIDEATLTKHVDWAAFESWRRDAGRRLILLTTRAEDAYTAFTYRDTDVLLFGRESAGVPESVHEAADARLTILMKPGMRSLNVASSVAMVTGEALRQVQQ